MNNDHNFTVVFDIVTDKLGSTMPRKAEFYRELDLAGTREKYYD